MKLIWHIVRKDLARMQLPLALWTLLLLAKITLGVVLRAGDGVDAVWFSRIELYIVLCTWLGAVMIYALVALLIHEDALVGTQAGWKTRPISGGRLLAAKLLGLALMFGLLPILISLPWWLACGFGLPEVGTAMLETLGWQALFVLPSLALAVISHNFSRYFTLTLAVIFVVALAGLFQAAYLPDLARASLPVQESRVWVVLTLILAGIVGVVLHQFLTLRTWRSSLLGLAAILLAMGSLSLWPWDLVTPFRSGVPEAARGITLALKKAVVGKNAEKLPTNVQVELKLQAVPADLAVLGYSSKLSWRGTDGSWLDAAGWVRVEGRGESIHHAFNLTAELEDAETQRWWTEKRTKFRMRFPTPPAFHEGEMDVNGYVNVKGYLAEQLPDKLDQGELTVELELARPAPLLEVPLKTGPRQAVGARSIRIVRVEPNAQSYLKSRDKNLLLRVVETQPANVVRFIRPLFRRGGGWEFNNFFGGASYWSVSRLQGKVSGVAGMGNGPTAIVNGVLITWAHLDVISPRVVRNGEWVVWRPDWADVVTLALVGYNDGASFSLSTKIDRLEEPKPAGAETP
jgi:hypothetical protein